MKKKKKIILLSICLLILIILFLILTFGSKPEKYSSVEELTCYGASYCYHSNNGCLSWIKKYGLKKWDCSERCPKEISEEALLIFTIKQCQEENKVLEGLKLKK